MSGWEVLVRIRVVLTILVRCCALSVVWCEEGLYGQVFGYGYLVSEPIVVRATRILGSQLNWVAEQKPNQVWGFRQCCLQVSCVAEVGLSHIIKF